jgi:ABC-type nickel/cobalt efflux system permease component RcnA
MMKSGNVNVNNVMMGRTVRSGTPNGRRMASFSARRDDAGQSDSDGFSDTERRNPSTTGHQHQHQHQHQGGGGQAHKSGKKSVVVAHAIPGKFKLKVIEQVIC